MANKRFLYCGKAIFAIGQAGSLADLKEKVSACLSCKEKLLCNAGKEYLQDLKRQEKRYNIV